MLLFDSIVGSSGCSTVVGGDASRSQFGMDHFIKPCLYWAAFFPILEEGAGFGLDS